MYLKKSINIITDFDGKKVVLINDVRFKSRRNIDWKKVELCLKEYVGQHYEIMETAEVVYIGHDFPDEFSHSEDKIKLKGANEKAKANMSVVIDKLIQIANNRKEYPNYNSKHKSSAKFGWYRFV